MEIFKEEYVKSADIQRFFNFDIKRRTIYIERVFEIIILRNEKK